MSFSKKNQSFYLNMDPLIDIVANIIGVLFFIVIYMVLVSFETIGKISTPLTSLSNTTRPMVFEARGETIFDPGITQLENEVFSVMKAAKEQGMDWRSRVKVLRESDIHNYYYQYRPRISLRKDYLIIDNEYLPIDQHFGEDKKLIKRVDSEFQGALAQLDPEKHHIYFFVRNDSFEMFHVARDIVLQKGFKVGWDPIDRQNPIIMGNDPSVSSFVSLNEVAN